MPSAPHTAETADFRGCIAAAKPFRGSEHKHSPGEAQYVAAVVVASLEEPACATIGLYEWDEP